MAACFAAPAHAEGSAYTIEITPPENATGTITYDIYKVFDATVAEDGTIAYSTTKDWPPRGGSGSETIANYFTKDSAGNVTAVLDDNGNPNSIGRDSTPENPRMTHGAIAAIEAFVEGDDPVKTVTTNASDPAATVLVTLDEPGYYYITTTTGSVVAVDSTNPTAAINDKNSLPTIEKYDRTDQDGTDDKSYHRHSARSVAIGDTIHYRLEVTIPSTVNDTVTIEDIMSQGLTPADPGSIVIRYRHNGKYENALEQGTDYTVAYSRNGGTPNGYTITIPYKPRSWTGLYIEYTATVNEKAVTEDAAKRNDVTLTYKTQVQTDYAEYKTYAAGIVKYDARTASVDPSSNELMKEESADGIRFLEARFTLQESKDNGSTWTDVKVKKDPAGFYYPDANGSTAIESDGETGQILFRGLGADNSDTQDKGGEPKSEKRQYRLVETKAPDGFNLPESPVVLLLTEDTKASAAITAGADGDTTYLAPGRVVKVANYVGAILPSTGGKGTAVLSIAGAGLAIAAGIGLVMRVRKRAS